MMLGRRVGVVVPAHNEERFIARVVAALPSLVDRVFVVDDGSRDGTAAAAVACPKVEVLRHGHAQGVGAAVVTGYRAALAAGMDVVVVTNGDAQMSGHELPSLVQPLLEDQADLVKGNRLLCPGTRGNIPAARRLGIHVLASLTRLATGYGHVGDCQSGYHAITKEALRRLPLETLWPGYGFPNDLLIKASRAGLRVQDRPVRAIYGDEQSGLRLRHVVKLAGTVVLPGLVGRVLHR